MLVVLSVIGLLASLTVPAVQHALEAARAAASRSNLHQLALANLAYAADHGGRFAPAQDPTNRVRWHGGRTTHSARFDPSEGYLSPYLGSTGRVGRCPLFVQMLGGDDSFEDGSGGYGYNATYIGGTNADRYKAAGLAMVPRPARTVMFTTSAFARKTGIQEYPFSEPYQWVDPNGNLAGALQPSTHFRANGRALVAWVDGHVTAEPPNDVSGTNVYGGDNEAARIGWFGPEADNGYWNPGYAP